jgi:outer membrane PBP1 activator LpoA protein
MAPAVPIAGPASGPISAPPAAPIPVIPGAVAPGIVVPAATSGTQGPFVALLLPLASPDFRPAAEAVRLGCDSAMAAASQRPQVQVLRTNADPEQILAEYDAAISRGAMVVVGPLTRSAVTALAGSDRVRVPTLALNLPDGNAALPQGLYTLGLSAEHEARLAARIAYSERMREAAVVQAATPLARRAAQAFASEWFMLGGRLITTLEFGARTDLAQLRRQLAKIDPDLIFLAANPENARTVRPYLASQVPVFATSQVWSGASEPLANVDLNGIRFVDMPWLVQPDHPAVMIYPRLENLSGELQRFYALGIDACRLSLELLMRRDRITLDGVTGRLSLSRSPVIEREPVQAIMRDGGGSILEGRRR